MFLIEFRTIQVTDNIVPRKETIIKITSGL
jgi:hypothetical protein